jgi:hypothetical protein
MSLSRESIQERRVRLAGEIARQRGELNEAYFKLKQPFRITEQGIRGFNFLRQNSWIFTAVPAALSIGSTLWGLRKPKPAPKSLFRQRERLEEEKPVKGLLGHALKWGGHGFRLFKLYRRVRPFFL